MHATLSMSVVEGFWREWRWRAPACLPPRRRRGSLALDDFADLTDEVKDASSLTEAANVVWYDKLDFEDRSEYENATRNLIAAPDALEICDDTGRVIWSQKAYTFVEGADAPASANPSLWENTRNNHVYGLFKVIDGIYQVRGYDMANLTLIEGQTGWIVIDTLMSVECTRAAMALVEEHLGERPVKAVIISHPHIDHYGGIKGVVSEEEAAKASMSLEEQLAGDKVPIIVPEHFEEHAVSENSYAGRAMGRRAAYQYGAYLEKGPQGSLAMGIGNGQSLGTTSYISPSLEIAQTGTELVIDGVTIQFQLTPGTEAPAEMNMWFPSSRPFGSPRTVAARSTTCIRCAARRFVTATPGPSTSWRQWVCMAPRWKWRSRATTGLIGATR